MDFPPEGDRTCVYNAQQLESVLDRMAWQAAAFLQGKNSYIVGILRRGAPLSQMLYERLLKSHDMKSIQLLQLKIKRYDDDLTLLHPETKLTEDPAHASLDLSGATVLVVDDVLYHGHSMLRAVEYLLAKNAAEIRTAVLVDRGACRLPVHADIAGLRLDVASSDVIECNVPPYETQFKVELLKLGHG